MLELVGFFTLVFVGATLVALTITHVANRRRMDTLQEDEQVRFKSADKCYRSRFIGVANSHWTFAAPLCRDCYVPLRVGEEVAVEAIRKDGIIAFRSRIVDRDEDAKTISIVPPRDLHILDRRSARRVSPRKPVQIEVDQTTAPLLDISEGGFRFESWREFTQGERILVKLPWMDIPVGAWILGERAIPGQQPPQHEYRAIFEQRLNEETVLTESA